MSKKEREQHIVFEQLKKGEITQVVAAKKLGVTPRWIREKLKRYRTNGEAGLVHQGRGKPGKRRWNPEQRALAINLLKCDWRGFGPKFAAEKLFKLYGVKVSKETLRQAMIESCLWIPNKKERNRRQRRERKTMFGVMVQVDGSPHDWFEGRAPKCTLFVFIDDATSKILWLEFATSESLQAGMSASKHYIEKFGIPQIIYVDHGSVFHVNLNNAEGNKKTHWEVAIESLGTQIKHAHSPQAKGRVERANGTMQDRLVKEMRLAKISSIEEANKFLRESSFIQDHNDLFSKPATQEGDAHKPLTGQDLEKVFCIREKRILANDFTIRYENRIFQLLNEQKAVIRPKDTIIVSERLDGKIMLSIRGTWLSFKELKFRPQKPVKRSECRPYKRSENSRRFASGLWPIHAPTRASSNQPRAS